MACKPGQPKPQRMSPAKVAALRGLVEKWAASGNSEYHAWRSGADEKYRWRSSTLAQCATDLAALLPAEKEIP